MPGDLGEENSRAAAPVVREGRLKAVKRGEVERLIQSIVRTIDEIPGKNIVTLVPEQSDLVVFDVSEDGFWGTERDEPKGVGVKGLKHRCETLRLTAARGSRCIAVSSKALRTSRRGNTGSKDC